MTDQVTRRIMVVNDTLDDVAEALTRALRLAATADGSVRVLVTRFEAVAHEPVEVMPPAHRDELIDSIQQHTRLALDRLVANLDSATPVATEVMWTPQPAEDITAAAAAWPADLLVKPVSAHHPIADYIHTPLDWALMREAPCPVLVCKGAAWTTPIQVLAAVDAGDEAHAVLNRAIVARGHQLAKRLDGALHLVSAYPDLGQTVGELQVATDFDGIKADMRGHRRAVLTGLVDELGIAAPTFHLLEGRPETVIPRLARELHASITILGTAARRGIAKLVIGNTAEHLLGRLPGDVETVRTPWS